MVINYCMKNFSSHIPLIITLLMIYAAYRSLSSEYIFSYVHYIAIALIIASWSLWGLPLLSKAATFLALLLATFCLASFTLLMSIHTFGFSIQGRGFGIDIQPYCLFLLIFFLIFNWSLVKRVIKDRQAPIV